MPQEDHFPQCYFFLSYARGDDSDSINRFYEDLCADVRDHAGLPRGTEVGFLDVHTIDLGAPWSARLTRYLAGCGTFLALVSPRYLRSEMCGREWSVFASRLAQHTAPGGEPPAALMPLLWLPPPVLPPVIEELQYHNELLPPAYRDKGLRQMIRLDRYRNEYVEFVDNLARQIVRTTEEAHVPPIALPLDLGKVRSIFDLPIPSGRPPRMIASTPPGGVANPDDEADPVTESDEAGAPSNHRAPLNNRAPESGLAGAVGQDRRGGPIGHRGPIGQGVRIVVAAPSAADVASAPLAALGRDARYYGADPVDWMPFLPELAVSLARFAQDVAQRHDFTAVVTDVANLHTALSEARTANHLVILLIDLWVTHLDEPRRILARYDGPADADDPLTAVMIPVSATDRHTQASHADLSRALTQLLGNRLRSLDGVLVRTSILSHRAFDADLQVVLERSRNQAFRTHPPYHRPPGRSGNRPILQGP